MWIQIVTMFSRMCFPCLSGDEFIDESHVSHTRQVDYNLKLIKVSYRLVSLISSLSLFVSLLSFILTVSHLIIWSHSSGTQMISVQTQTVFIKRIRKIIIQKKCIVLDHLLSLQHFSFCHCDILSFHWQSQYGKVSWLGFFLYRNDAHLKRAKMGQRKWEIEWVIIMIEEFDVIEWEKKESNEMKKQDKRGMKWREGRDRRSDEC